MLPLLGFAHDSSSTYCVLLLAEAMKEQRSEDPGSTSEALVNNQVKLAERGRGSIGFRPTEKEFSRRLASRDKQDSRRGW